MKDVIVVGAGVAGLTAARELLEAGLSVSLIEARTRVGGRLYAEEAGPNGDLLELGGQFFRPSKSPELEHELQRYSIGVEPAPIATKQHIYFDDQLWDLSEELERSPGELLAFLRIVKTDSVALVFDGQGSRLHRLSVDAYLEQFSFTPIVGTWLRAWIEQYAGNSLGQVSAASMLKLVSGAGGSIRAAGHSSAHFIKPSTASLTEAIAGDIRPAIRTGIAVSAVRRHDTGAGFMVDTTEGPEPAKTVIMAVPRNVIAEGTLKIGVDFRAEAQVALTTPQPGYGYKVWARVTGNVPEKTMILGNMEGFRLLSSGQTAADGSTWVVLFANNETLGDNVADIDRWARAAIGLVWGDSVTTLEVKFHDWVADPFARGAWTVTGIDGDSSVAALHEACPPDMAFIGADYCFERGGVESALRSAKDAAALIRTYVHGLSPRPPRPEPV